MKNGILTKAQFDEIEDICEKLYEETGPSAVYAYCDEKGIKYDYCSMCECDTPTLKYKTYCTCAVCGQGKG